MIRRPALLVFLYLFLRSAGGGPLPILAVPGEVELAAVVEVLGVCGAGAGAGAFRV